MIPSTLEAVALENEPSASGQAVPADPYSLEETRVSPCNLSPSHVSIWISKWAKAVVYLVVPDSSFALDTSSLLQGSPY